MIDFHIFERPWSAAKRDSLGSDPIEDAIELRLINLECVMVAFKLNVIVKIKRQRVVDLHRSKMRDRAIVAKI